MHVVVFKSKAIKG